MEDCGNCCHVNMFLSSTSANKKIKSVRMNKKGLL